MCDRDELRLRADRGVDSVDLERTVIAHIDPFQHRALPLPQEVPGHDVRMMLHHRKHDLVARLDAGAAKP